MQYISMAKIFQAELDKKFLQQATSSFMEPNASMVRYHGGDTVFLPDIDMDGLGNYDRAKGYPAGGVVVTWKPYSLTQDRGRQFMIDSMDEDESAFVASAGNVMGEFQRRYVVPEIDSYRYSKIFSVADAYNLVRKEDLTSANILDIVQDDLAQIIDKTGEDRENFVLVMNTLTHATFVNNDKIQKILGVTDFERGDLKTQVKSLDGTAILPVSSNRMKTAYVSYDGRSEGQEQGGLAPALFSKTINYLIVHKKSPIAVSKTDKMRIFDPATNQDADAWKMDYRKYHDLWVPYNKIDGIFANIPNT